MSNQGDTEMSGKEQKEISVASEMPVDDCMALDWHTLKAVVIAARRVRTGALTYDEQDAALDAVIAAEEALWEIVGSRTVGPEARRIAGRALQLGAPGAIHVREPRQVTQAAPQPPKDSPSASRKGE